MAKHLARIHGTEEDKVRTAVNIFPIDLKQRDA